ncbi:MAG: hypothetical protein ACXAAQ_02210 [Candidatus Thorarchaeota archaeon]
MSSDNTEPLSIAGVENDTAILIGSYVRIHFTFMFAYWLAIIMALVVVHIFPQPYWMSVNNWYDLAGLFLSLLPIMIVMSINMRQVRRLLENKPSRRFPVFTIIALVGLAIVLLIPITLFMRNLTVSLLYNPVVFVSVTWLAVLIYVITAGAIVTEDSIQFVKRCLQRPQFWSAIGLTIILIFVSLVPLAVGFLGSEAWQYYSSAELLLRRILIYPVFTFPAAPLMPLLDATATHNPPVLWFRKNN